jgi:hypothetical protein
MKSERIKERENSRARCFFYSCRKRGSRKESSIIGWCNIISQPGVPTPPCTWKTDRLTTVLYIMSSFSISIAFYTPYDKRTRKTVSAWWMRQWKTDFSPRMKATLPCQYSMWSVTLFARFIKAPSWFFKRRLFPSSSLWQRNKTKPYLIIHQSLQPMFLNGIQSGSLD